MDAYDQFSEMLDNMVASEIRVSCIVGAGLSAGSGLSTFRGKGGMYEEKDAFELASRKGFEENPLLVWTWYRDRIEKVMETEPNEGHYALVELEKMGVLESIVTQNVDGLHIQAGQSRDKLVEIHGTLSRTHCLDNCGRSYELCGVPEEIPVKCECGSYQRPSVVWFGEAIPHNVMEIIDNMINKSSILLVIGTSGTVVPVARIPYLVANDMKIVNINPDTRSFEDIADVSISGKAEEALPKIVEIIRSKI